MIFGDFDVRSDLEIELDFGDVRTPDSDARDDVLPRCCRLEL